jgi:uncharacterized protein (TIGR00251 family)
MVEDLFDVAGDGGIILRVHVQPGAGRTAVVGRHGAALKVRVAAPPEGGRANEACRVLLAETFGVAVGDVELAAGPASRHKRFRIAGVEPEAFRRRLAEAVAAPGTAGPSTRRRPS